MRRRTVHSSQGVAASRGSRAPATFVAVHAVAWSKRSIRSIEVSPCLGSRCRRHGEQLEAIGPTLRMVDATAHAAGTRAMPFEAAMLELDPSAGGAFGDEPHLDLAGVGGIGVVLPVLVELPGQHESTRRLELGHSPGVALGAVDADLVPTAADLWLHHEVGHVGFTDRVLLG